jgi:hypothetical protein
MAGEDNGVADTAVKVGIIALGICTAKLAETAVSWAIGGSKKDSGGKKGGKRRRSRTKS